jgi:hypothetical protein
MSTYGREERADPAVPDRVSTSSANPIGEDAEAQATRDQVRRAVGAAVPGGVVARIPGAGELAPDSRADWHAATRSEEGLREPALLLGLLGRDREVIRVEGTLDLDGRARRARIRRGAVQAGKREVWVLLDCHVEFPIVLS